ncbi:MAG: hypothetical protein IJY31_03175 [Muribaculaceae bacterium]|nr:hypothetical protein [Muribaculaceae bacterium]
MKLKNLFGILMMLSLCAGFVSCSDDDEEDNAGGINQSLLIGSWLRMDGNQKWVFEADGKFEWWWNNEYSGEWELDCDDDRSTWHMEGDVIVLYGDDEYYQIQELTQEKLVVKDVEEGKDPDIDTYYRM